MLQLVTASGARPGLGHSRIGGLPSGQAEACPTKTVTLYPLGRRRTILTSGAEGDPSSSFHILPISQSEIRRAELAVGFGHSRIGGLPSGQAEASPTKTVTLYPVGRRRTILTLGAEGDPSSSFLILPISRSEIRRAELALQTFLSRGQSSTIYALCAVFCS
jgi:hypothetical protein